MARNMDNWVRECRDGLNKRPIPVLSFPGAKWIGKTVEELVKDGHSQALCMKAVAERFDTAAAFSLMDLSVEAEAFGCQVHYSEEDVPTIKGILIHDEKEAERLRIPEVGAGRTGECLKGIKEASGLINDRPVIAGIIGPYSLAGRMLDMTEIMILCFEEPDLVETVLEKSTEFLIRYAQAFKEAGANGIVLAEPAAGLLSPGMIAEFSNPYVERIRRAVEDESFLFIYHNCGNVIPLLGEIGKMGIRAFSFGNAVDLETALKKLPDDRIIMGNLDPAGILRNGTPELIKEETNKLLERCSSYPNFMLSSGCDIPPQTSEDNLKAFFAAASEYYGNGV